MRKLTTPGQLELWANSALPQKSQRPSSDEQQDSEGKFSRLSSPTEDFSLSFEDPSEDAKSPNLNFAQNRPLKILVADDNGINRKVIRIILQKLGYECAEVENGAEALNAYQSHDYDYIFMDLDMPEMDGLESTMAIREAEKDSEQQHTEIIAVTANVSQETRLKCRRAGMNGYLEKPITATIIKDQILRSWSRIRARKKA